MVHHTPEYYDGDETTRVLQPEEFPHDWQLIFLGTLSPVAVDGSGPAAPLTIPTDTPLLGAEYTMTPPPNFSLNSLLNGELGWLLGSVYNGSFDTPYERIPIAIGNVSVLSLTTTQWLNASAALTPTANLQYLSYPRQPNAPAGTAPLLYMAHQITAQPDFDQVIQVELSQCTGDVSAGLVPGVAWVFPGTSNTMNTRLMPGGAPWKVALAAGSTPLTCQATVLEEIHCVAGPDFGNPCPPVPSP